MTLPLLLLPYDVAVRIIKMLPLPTCACFCRVCRDAQGLVVQSLRDRAMDAGRTVAQLAVHETSWLQALLWREWWQITHRPPSLAMDQSQSLIIGKDGGLRSCGQDLSDNGAGQPLRGLTGHGPRQFVHKLTVIPTLLEVRIVAVAAGSEHSLAVSEAGHLFSWGCGWLGHGDNRGRDVPSQVTAIGVEVREVAAGCRCSLAIDRFGVAYTWGDGFLGHSSRQVKPGEPHLQPGDRQICAYPKRLDAMPEAVCSAAAGACHFLAIGESGALYSWGHSLCSACGHGTDLNQLFPMRVEALQERVRSVSANAMWSMALSETGSVFTWGGFVALGHGEGAHVIGMVPARVQALPQSVCSISAGNTHAMALTSGGELYTWGASPYGAIGHVCIEQLTPKKVTYRMGASQDPSWEGLTKIAAGWHTSVAITDGGKAWGWGFAGGPAGALGMRSRVGEPMDHAMAPMKYAEAHEWC